MAYPSYLSDMDESAESSSCAILFYTKHGPDPTRNDEQERTLISLLRRIPIPAKCGFQIEITDSNKGRNASPG